MVLTYNGGISASKPMPGGGPAGTTLGLLMFVILINRMANPGVKQDWGSLLSSPVRGRSPVIMTHAKLIDDASVAESVPMEEVLEPQDERYWVRPLPRRSRLELAVPSHRNRTDAELVKMVRYANRNFMEINKKKTKVLLFNPRKRGLDFQTRIMVDGEALEVVEQIRLVGLILSDDLSWRANTDSLVKRAFAKIWILRRLKALGASQRVLKLIYYQHVRSILEFGVPAWNSGISTLDIKKLESLESSCELIFGGHKSYSKLLEEAKWESLEIRREKLCTKFAMKAAKHKKFKSWFKEINSEGSNKKACYAETVYTHKRLRNSPIPYLTRLLNKKNGHSL